MNTPRLALRQLQNSALQALNKNYLAPARYGTAFHLTPPATDVRQLKQTVLAPATSLWDEDFEKLPQRYQDIITSVNLTDVYLTWLLVGTSIKQWQIIWVKPGQECALSVPAGGLVWLFIGEGARVTLEGAIAHNTLATPRLFVWQEKHSHLAYVGLRANTAFLNEKLEVHLSGVGAAVDITHFIYGTVKEQADIEVRVFHQGKRTHSNISARLAVADQARVIYRGLIDVDQNAGGAEGFQSVRSLLLSDRAVIDVLPQLNIRTNDVRCSHGVTTSHLDDLALFYLRSRGLTYHQAREQALRGFFHHQLVVPEAITIQLDNFLLKKAAQKYGNTNASGD